MGYRTFVVGSFESGQSGSPYSFVSKNAQPKGPFVVLNTKKTRGSCPERGALYLVEVEYPEEMDQRVRYAVRLVAPLETIRDAAIAAMRDAEWERDRYGRVIGIVGRVVKTEYGYFTPKYLSGHNSNGWDTDPRIVFEPVGTANPYWSALETPRAQSALATSDKDLLDRVKNAPR